jgi:hypothetical protein
MAMTLTQDDVDAIVAGIMAEIISGTTTVQDALTDIWAESVGAGEADDPTNPTEITYRNPAGNVQVTHTFTDTTRTKT